MILRRPVLEYYLKNTFTVFGWFLLVYTAIFAIFVIIMSGVIIGGDGSYGSFGGFEGVAVICLFIVALNSFREEFHLFLQLGVSRKSAFAGYALHVLIASALIAIAALIGDALFSGIASLVGSQVEVASLFSQSYGQWMESGSGVFGMFLWTWTLFLSVSVFGYFLTNLFYRLGKLGKVLVPVTVGVLLFVVLPILDRVTNGWVFNTIWGAVATIFRGNGEIASPVNSIIFFFVGGVVGLALCWLLMRRAPLKK
ncbi:MAG: hypothetical protein FWD99_03275 [Oscillospiraceae bacterium]|nr:hypothetical protein [Oscillospiraceae bacterium]